MRTVRLYDAERQPPGWWQIIQPGEYVVFSQDVEFGAPCDVNGDAFPSPDAATCAIFGSMSDAAAFCRGRVEQIPGVRFDIFDAAGRTSRPLLTVVHSSQENRLESKRMTRVNNWVAALMLMAAPLLLWFDWAKHDGVLVVPTVIGLNFVVFAARILFLNRTYAAAEQSRRERAAQHFPAPETRRE